MLTTKVVNDRALLTTKVVNNKIILIWEVRSDVATVFTHTSTWTRIRSRRIQSPDLIPTRSVFSVCPRTSWSHHSRYTNSRQPFNNGDHVVRWDGESIEPSSVEREIKKKTPGFSCTKFQYRTTGWYELRVLCLPRLLYSSFPLTNFILDITLYIMHTCSLPVFFPSNSSDPLRPYLCHCLL